MHYLLSGWLDAFLVSGPRVSGLLLPAFLLLCILYDLRAYVVIILASVAGFSILL